jgi:hypothetical protein
MGIRCALCLLLAVTGCVSLTPKRQIIKAPTHEEQFDLPPDDARFSNPPQYPKGTLNKDNHNKDLDEPDGLPGAGKMRSTGMGMGGMQ